MSEIFLSPKPKQVTYSAGVYKVSGQDSDKASLGFDGVFGREVRQLFGRRPFVLKKTVRSGLVKVPKVPEQAYHLKVTPKGISITANTQTGALYALQTLRQLKIAPATFQCCDIVDYPDTEWRVAARPLLCGEVCRSALDWGDGRAAFLKRWKFEIDFALASRYNGIFCYGPTLDIDCWPEYAKDMRMLNRYARKRGVRLIYFLYGISYGGFGGETYMGEAHAFVPGAGCSVKQDYICGINYPPKPETGKNGTCRSNPELWAQRVKDVRKFIKAIEPGGLYIHHEDISDYHKVWELFWDLRCPECRKKWPNNAADAMDGGAGAIAHGYDSFGEARKGVKNKFFDAERDCSLWLVSPCYGSVGDDDEAWGHVMSLWCNVAKAMKTKNNVYLTLREQYLGENGKLRIKELADKFTKIGAAQKIMIFAVGGGALYGENASFSSMTEMCSFFAGAHGVFTFSGVIYQRPQQLFNSECTWNLDYHEGGETVDPRKYDRNSALALLNDKISHTFSVEERHQKPDGWLSKACQLIYGKKAGEKMFQYLQLCVKRHLAYPLSIIYKHAMMDRVMEETKPPFPTETRRVDLCWQRTLQDHIDYWEKLDALTAEGLALIQEAAALTRRGPLQDELIQQTRTLAFGQIFCKMMGGFFRYAKTPSPAEKDFLKKTLLKMRKMSNSFPKDFMTPNDGETSLYPAYCDKMEKMIQPKKAVKAGF